MQLFSPSNSSSDSLKTAPFFLKRLLHAEVMNRTKSLALQAHCELNSLATFEVTRGEKTGKGNEVARCLDLPAVGWGEDHMQPFVSLKLLFF